MSAILKAHRIDSGIGIGQKCGGELAPGFPMVGRPGLEDPALAGAAKCLKAILAMAQKGGLNGANVFAVVDRVGSAPGLAQARGAFEVDLPAMVFVARGTKDFGISELDRFVLDRAENAVGQSPRFRPVYSSIL